MPGCSPSRLPHSGPPPPAPRPAAPRRPSPTPSRAGPTRPEPATTRPTIASQHDARVHRDPIGPPSAVHMRAEVLSLGPSGNRGTRQASLGMLSGNNEFVMFWSVVRWLLVIHPEVRDWLHEIRKADRETAALIGQAIQHVIDGRGPDVGRPLVDRVKGSRLHNSGQAVIGRLQVPVRCEEPARMSANDHSSSTPLASASSAASR